MLISQVELPVSDAEQVAVFYRDVLGLPVRAAGHAVEVQIGPTTLVLRRQEVMPGAYHCAITIPGDRFDQAKDWLRQRVALLERDGQDEFRLGAPWNSQSVYFTGPDGIILELIARHDLPAASSGPFASTDLLRISEVGLAVPDVPLAVSHLRETLRLPVFGTAAADFTPLGDPNGLLIVVRRGRPWFPTTSVTPSAGPVGVTIEAVVGRRSLRVAQDGQIEGM
jgi:catechol 2,3-dioxygenase-like lactoylglutathione lyase family enzyme